MNAFFETWHWSVSGLLIALVLFLLLMVGKNFGMSSNLRTFCTLCGADKRSDFFKFDWKSQQWNLIVVLGAIIGGYIGSEFLSTDLAVAIHPETIEQLNSLGFKSAGTSYLPNELFDSAVFSDLKGLAILSIGGLFIGFGSRYAGGCTSGHAISGLSNLQWPSLVAVVGFFIGGLTMVHFIFPLIF